MITSGMLINFAKELGFPLLDESTKKVDDNSRNVEVLTWTHYLDEDKGKGYYLQFIQEIEGGSSQTLEVGLISDGKIDSENYIRRYFNHLTWIDIKSAVRCFAEFSK